MEVTTVGLSEVLAPKSRIEKDVAEGLDWFWVDMVLLVALILVLVSDIEVQIVERCNCVLAFSCEELRVILSNVDGATGRS